MFVFNLLHAGMAELAVFNRALPVADEAKVEKTQRSEVLSGSEKNSVSARCHARAAARVIQLVIGDSNCLRFKKGNCA